MEIQGTLVLFEHRHSGCRGFFQCTGSLPPWQAPPLRNQDHVRDPELACTTAGQKISESWPRESPLQHPSKVKHLPPHAWGSCRPSKGETGACEPPSLAIPPTVVASTECPRPQGLGWATRQIRKEERNGRTTQALDEGTGCGQEWVETLVPVIAHCGRVLA